MTSFFDFHYQKSHEDIAQTKDDYLEDARLERELTGDELMGLPNEDIGPVFDIFYNFCEYES